MTIANRRLRLRLGRLRRVGRLGRVHLYTLHVLVVGRQVVRGGVAAGSSGGGGGGGGPGRLGFVAGRLDALVEPVDSVTDDTVLLRGSVGETSAGRRRG